MADKLEELQAQVQDLEVSPQFLQFIEANGGGADMDPLSDDAVKIQAQYIRDVGSNPFEVLKAIVANPFVKSGDRINAAKTLLEYSARKIPTNVEISGPKGGPVTVELTSAAALKAMVRG